VQCSLFFLVLPHILYYDVGGIGMNNNRILSIVVLVLSLVINFLRPSMVTDLPRVAHGVTLSGDNIAYLDEEALVTLLEGRAAQLAIAPVQPLFDKVGGGVIPGLAGRELDIAGTVASCLGALPGTERSYVFRAVMPEAPSLNLPIYRGNARKRKVAFVINVAWGNEELMEILEILDDFQLKKTFFLVGRWVSKYPELVREIYRRGHELGNHAYSDLHLSRQAAGKVKEEILNTTEAIRAAVGQVSVKYFSPPYNDFNQDVIEIAASLGYQTVLCSLDTADWMRQGVDKIVQRIVPRAHNGAIVLMHPAKDTPRALKVMIPALQEMGFVLVTLGELLSPLP